MYIRSAKIVSAIRGNRLFSTPAVQEGPWLAIAGPPWLPRSFLITGGRADRPIKAAMRLSALLTALLLGVGSAVAQAPQPQVTCTDPEGPAATEQAWPNASFRCPGPPLRALRGDMVHVRYLGADPSSPFACKTRSNSTDSPTWLGFIAKGAFPTEEAARALAGLMQTGATGWVSNVGTTRSPRGGLDTRQVVWVLEGYQALSVGGQIYEVARFCRTDRRMMMADGGAPDITSQRVWVDRRSMVPIASNSEQVTVGFPRQTMGAITYPHTGMDWEIVEWFRDTAPPVR